ncbi:MAG: sigma-70 family RNA polymerase sigma factor [Acidobacteriota bacterium]
MEKRADDVTELLFAWRNGQRDALDRLMPMVYQELRSVAAGYLRRERPDHTLEPTAVLHEAYLRLVDKTHPHWKGRRHFFAVAAQTMRRILVDHARRHGSAKRGGGAVRLPIDDGAAAGVAEPRRSFDLLALDEALDRLAEFDDRKSRAIELRFFGGLTHDEVAEVLDMSRATVRLDIRLAKAWLATELAENGAQ